LQKKNRKRKTEKNWKKTDKTELAVNFKHIAKMNMGSSFVHTKAEGETTQWDDILRAKGITQPSQAELDKAAAEEIRKAVEEAVDNTDVLALKTVGELDELEEEGGEFEDSRTLDAYREARIAEMKAAAKRNRFGEVYPLTRVDFVREVNDASKDGTWVVIHLHQDHVEDSMLLGRAVNTLAGRKREVKFMVSKADQCIDGYPDKNVPTLLLYRNGELQSQIVTLSDLGGKKVSSTSSYLVQLCRLAPLPSLHPHPLLPQPLCVKF